MSLLLPLASCAFQAALSRRVARVGVCPHAKWNAEGRKRAMNGKRERERGRGRAREKGEGNGKGELFGSSAATLCSSTWLGGFEHRFFADMAS